MKEQYWLQKKKYCQEDCNNVYLIHKTVYSHMVMANEEMQHLQAWTYFWTSCQQNNLRREIAITCLTGFIVLQIANIYGK